MTQRNQSSPGQLGLDESHKRFSTGIAWALGLVVSRHGIQLVSTLIVARLLLPEDFGRVGMVNTLTGILFLLLDLGLSWAAIQKKDLTQGQQDNLFWLNTGVGFVLWAACVLIAPLLERFYHQPGLLSLTAVQGMSFVLLGVAVQPGALLRRNLRFGLLAKLDLASLMFGTVIGIGLAWKGFGPWALVLNTASVNLVRAILILATAGYRPGAPSKNQGTLQLLKFGGYMTASAFAFYIARNLDDILVGRFLGVEQLAFYQRAYFLMEVPNQLASGAMAGVAIPAMSALRDDHEQLGKMFRRAVEYFNFFSVPACVGLILTSDETVRVVYGTKWMAAVPLLTWLAVAGVFQPLYRSTGWLLVATGQMRAYFSWSLYSGMVCALGFAIGIQYGTRGVAISYAVVCAFFLAAPSMIFTHKRTGIPLAKTLKGVWGIFGAAGAMSTVVLLLKSWSIFMALPAWLRLLGEAVGGGLVYLSVSLWLMEEFPIPKIQALKDSLLRRR